MNSKGRLLNCVLMQVFTLGVISAQPGISEAQFKDFANQAKRQVLVFFDNVAELGANTVPESIREKAISNVTKVFTVNGTVEERSKGAKSGISRPVREYLNVIAQRGQKAPILVSYDFVDPLTYQEFKPVTESDGSIVYRGEMIVKQYYCKLKPKDQLSDKLDSNCSYEDTTTKKVTVEVRLLKSQTGKSYAVLISNIVVLSVS